MKGGGEVDRDSERWREVWGGGEVEIVSSGGRCEGGGGGEVDKDSEWWREV